MSLWVSHNSHDIWNTVIVSSVVVHLSSLIIGSIRVFRPDDGLNRSKISVPHDEGPTSLTDECAILAPGRMLSHLSGKPK
ncbi:hypothetical protein NEOLEDRAFT_552504 [Neolentinus lepideus HHB14362 ss-1]|uniref:Uncharacterized protein n=1 Tax=Neolentinus lepideus HHB14362 ss-1 TaxID=1314782 RepID=A0A165R4I2_9AGAM|nr:hypothetical protein NEOLEDRAFT_552504 [Neolentinus lepideus HHB14362 ss-1]